MGSCLEDVEAAVGGDRNVTFGGVRAYVVNFDASNSFPSKFMYRGCGVQLGKKWTCSRSVERSACEHDINGEHTSVFFRFDVFLTDGSLGGRPFRATIFGAAATLLGISVGRFRRFSEEDQKNHVMDAIHGSMPYCELSVKAGNGEVIIQSLRFLKMGPAPRKQASDQSSECGEWSSKVSTYDTPSASGSTSLPSSTPPPKKEEMSLSKAVKFISKKLLDLAGSDSE